jgi:hypothetical protein
VQPLSQYSAHREVENAARRCGSSLQRRNNSASKSSYRTRTCSLQRNRRQQECLTTARTNFHTAVIRSCSLCLSGPDRPAPDVCWLQSTLTLGLSTEMALPKLTVFPDATWACRSGTRGAVPVISLSKPSKLIPRFLLMRDAATHCRGSRFEKRLQTTETVLAIVRLADHTARPTNDMF